MTEDLGYDAAKRRAASKLKVVPGGTDGDPGPAEPAEDPGSAPSEYQGSSDVADVDDLNSYEALVVGQMRLMRIRREAKQRLDDEERPPPAPPSVKVWTHYSRSQTAPPNTALTSWRRPRDA